MAVTVTPMVRLASPAAFRAVTVTVAEPLRTPVTVSVAADITAVATLLSDVVADKLRSVPLNSAPALIVSLSPESSDTEGGLPTIAGAS